MPCLGRAAASKRLSGETPAVRVPSQAHWEKARLVAEFVSEATRLTDYEIGWIAWGIGAGIGAASGTAGTASAGAMAAAAASGASDSRLPQPESGRTRMRLSAAKSFTPRT